MEKILTSAKFRFIAIQNPLRAITTLLARKPDLVFLDLVMPDTNGYEICAQLRKTSLFRDTPIIILTGNDGVIDRVRAKVVGSSDFLAKPVNAETVLSVVYKHLKYSDKMSKSTVVG
jgi:chemotaxis family two-component system response regulator PixG